MIRIAIVEDEATYVQQMKGFLETYKKEKKEDFQITVFSDGTEIVKEYHAEFDLIFLDIQMKTMNGMTTAEWIRGVDENVAIIFVTNMAQYAIKGYSVNALDFILKPLSYFAFSQKLKRALEHIKPQSKKLLNLRIDGGLVRVDLEQVTFVESMKHRIMVHTPKENYVLTGTMKEMEEKLTGESFFRCNNCYLVNLSYVEKIVGNDVVVAGESLQISRPKKKAFMAALTDYIGGLV